MDQAITFIIDTEGNVKIAKVEGYGSECLTATKLIENRLGTALTDTRKLTYEIYHPPTSSDTRTGIEL